MDPTIVAAVALVAVALIGLAVAPVSATVRAAVLFGACALSALAAPTVALLAAVAIAAAFVVDAIVSRRRPVVHRRLPGALARGVPASLTLDAESVGAGSLRLRQPLVPDVAVEPAEADGHLDARVRAGRRGRHTLPSPAAQMRGPLGLGTDFESIRDYLPDDDFRQVNWRATARMGRPMSNQYRVEQDRDVVCMLDAGRLMAAPLGDRTRLDATIDAATAVALVADEVGDRAGVIAFDDRVRRRLPPARGGGDAVVHAVFDVEPTMVDSDYELAFRAVGSGKRAFVLVLTDLLEEAAAQPLLDAMPVLARRHAVVVAGVTDPDLEQMVHAPPRSPADVYTAAVALDVLDARARVAAQLRRAGADVVEARPDLLPNACVGAYLRAKARARL